MGLDRSCEVRPDCPWTRKQVMTVFEPMAGHFVPSGRHLQHGVRLSAHLRSENKERRLDVQLVQGVKCPSRVEGGTIVEGESHLRMGSGGAPTAQLGRQ